MSHRLSSRFDTFPVPDCAELFTAWVSSDRQAALYAKYVPQSPLGLGALLGLPHQVPVRATFLFEALFMCISTRCLATQWYFLTWDMDAVGRGTS